LLVGLITMGCVGCYACAVVLGFVLFYGPVTYSPVDPRVGLPNPSERAIQTPLHNLFVNTRTLVRQAVRSSMDGSSARAILQNAVVGPMLFLIILVGSVASDRIERMKNKRS
jgi:hypothetical protein